MQPVEIAPPLERVILALARERQLGVARDTHYDAFNIELLWWIGNRLHRLDFRPYPDGHVEVAAIHDSFPPAGRLFWWLARVVPMFPYLASTKRIPLGTLRPPFSSQTLPTEIDEFFAKAA
jgi:hypothetical protein